MYKLPSDFDCSFLIGKRIDQVCINENQVGFHFDDCVSITTETDFIFQDGTGNKMKFTIPVKTGDYLSVVGLSVKSCSGEPDGTLVLIFDELSRLEFLDTSNQFESYHINFDGKTITV